MNGEDQVPSKRPSIVDIAQKSDCKNNGTFDLTTNNDVEFINGVVEESIGIASAPINVFKLLGIHEQGKLIDLTGSGKAISNGDANEYPSSNAFDVSLPEWRSLQKGSDVISSSFIGYDFGPIMYEPTQRERYGIDTRVKQHITTIRIRQVSEYRVTKARVEYSPNGGKWYGAGIVNLPDDNELNQLSFKSSTPARYWRIRPLAFTGDMNNAWKVCELQLIDYDTTSLTNIQDDMGFLEARDRDYSSESILMKGYYDIMDVQSDLTRFGFEWNAQQIFFHISFSESIRKLGRSIVIGDILELPSETQYTTKLQPVLKYLEVTDIAWSTDGYAPSWQPVLQRIIAQPLLASQETLDVIGDFAPEPDSMGFLDIATNNIADMTSIDHLIEASADTNTPERGKDFIDVAHFDDEQIQQAADQGFDISKLSYDSKTLYVEDGLPPNGEEYTTGDEYPEDPIDKHYHRLTFTNSDMNIPPRLYRYSLLKGRWIYCETDRRSQYNNLKPHIQNMLEDDDSTSLEDINK